MSGIEHDNKNIDNVYIEILNLLKLKVKGIKIYDAVLMEFSQFMSDHRELKQQDAVSQALWEFIKKYK